MAIRIVALGDSNSVNGGQGGGVTTWPSVLHTTLHAHYAQDYALTNSSVAGMSAPYFVTNLASKCLDYDPHIVCVMLGTNDTYDTAAVFEAAMRTIIEGVQGHTNADGTTPLMVLGQPPIAMGCVYGTRSGYTGYISYPWTSGDPYNYGRPRNTIDGVVDGAGGLVQFAAIVDALAAEYGCAVAPVYDDLSAAASPWDGTANTTHAYIMDGVHLTTAGNVPVAATMFDAVDSLLDADGAVDYHADAPSGTDDGVGTDDGTEPTAEVGWVYDLAESIDALYDAPAGTDTGAASDTGTTPTVAADAPTGTDVGIGTDGGETPSAEAASAWLYDLAAAIDAIYDVPAGADAGRGIDSGTMPSADSGEVPEVYRPIATTTSSRPIVTTNNERPTVSVTSVRPIIK